ncbi:hypothetical protein ACHWQZ_G006874 [Mnemiopsis leidyi]
MPRRDNQPTTPSPLTKPFSIKPSSKSKTYSGGSNRSEYVSPVINKLPRDSCPVLDSFSIGCLTEDSCNQQSYADPRDTTDANFTPTKSTVQKHGVTLATFYPVNLMTLHQTWDVILQEWSHKHECLFFLDLD